MVSIVSQQVKGYSGTSPFTLALTGVTSTDHIYVAVLHSLASVQAVTSVTGFGATWSEVANPSSSNRLIVWRGVSPSSASGDVTVTMAGANSHVASAWVVRGASTALTASFTSASTTVTDGPTDSAGDGRVVLALASPYGGTQECPGAGALPSAASWTKLAGYYAAALYAVPSGAAENHKVTINGGAGNTSYIGQLVVGDAPFATGSLSFGGTAGSKAAISAPAVAYSQQALDLTPSAYYRMGEASGSLADSSGNGRTLTTSGSGHTYGVAGALVGDSNAAMTFSGNTEWGNTDGSFGETRTIVGWIKTTSTTLQRPYGTFFEGNGVNYFSVATTTTGKAQGHVNGVDFAGTATVNDGAWHMVALAVDFTTGTGRLYVDGVLDTTQTGLTQQNLSRRPFVGGRFAGYVGSIDEVAYYNTTLSGAQLATLYTAGTTSGSVSTATGSLSFGGTAGGGVADILHVASLVTMQSATATAFTVTVPSGIASGDTLVVSVGAGTTGSGTVDGSPAPTLSGGGWTLRQESKRTNGQLWVWSKTLNGTETSFTLSPGDGATYFWHHGRTVYRGVGAVVAEETASGILAGGSSATSDPHTVTVNPNAAATGATVYRAAFCHDANTGTGFTTNGTMRTTTAGDGGGRLAAADWMGQTLAVGTPNNGTLTHNLPAFTAHNWFAAALVLVPTAAPVAATAAATGSLTFGGTAAATGGAGGTAASATGSLALSGSSAARAATTATGFLSLSGTSTARVAGSATGSLALSGTGNAGVGSSAATATGSLSLSAAAVAGARVTAATGALALSGTATAGVPEARTATGSFTFSGSANRVSFQRYYFNYGGGGSASPTDLWDGPEGPGADALGVMFQPSKTGVTDSIPVTVSAMGAGQRTMIAQGVTGPYFSTTGIASGYVRAAFRGFQSNLAGDCYLTLTVRVIDQFTATERGVFVASVDATTEWDTTEQVRVIPVTALSPVNVQPNDRLVVEVGVARKAGASNTTSSATVEMTDKTLSGDVGYSDSAPVANVTVGWVDIELTSQSAPVPVTATGSLSLSGVALAPVTATGSLSLSGIAFVVEVLPAYLLVLTPALDQPPATLTVAMSNLAPLTVVTFRINAVIVGTGVTDVGGDIDATMLVVDRQFGVGTHTVSGTTATQVASSTFTIARAAAALPVLVPAHVAPAVVANAVNRWVLQDPGGLGSWVMPINPTAMGNPHVRKSVGAVATTAVFGRPHVSEGARPVEWEFSGFAPDQAFQNQLIAYSQLPRRFYLIDHRSRAWTVAIASLDIRPRKRTRDQNGVDQDWLADYTVRLALFSQTPTVVT